MDAPTTDRPSASVRPVATRQSVHTGVNWNAQTSKWKGSLGNRLTGKLDSTTPILFEGTAAGEEACRVAVETLRARHDADFEAYLTRLQDEHPWTRELERAPDDLSSAEKGVVYWHVYKRSGEWCAPYRALAIGAGAGRKMYMRACQDCNQRAIANVVGGGAGAVPTHCAQHGGGGARMCSHGRQRVHCRECSGHTHRFCSTCHHTSLDAKRQCRNGGNGLCAPCETHANAQAAANGTTGPAMSKRCEDVVFERLLPLVVDAATDHPISPELRDDFSSAIGSLFKELVDGDGRRTRKRVRGSGDCDTTTYRRPDALWVVRDPVTSRIAAAIAVEVDEHSHDGRAFDCETGKVEDTFQAVQKLAAGEGASKASRTGVRVDAELVLFHTLKFNPNACDLSPLKLDDRIAVLAKHLNALLRTPAAAFAAMPPEARMVPHVTCLFYHSAASACASPAAPTADGAPLAAPPGERKVFLEAYRALEPDWTWGGNLLA